MLRKEKTIFPLLFAWILIFGFLGLACSLHLCHSGEDGLQGLEATGHDHHGDEGGCCDAVSELLLSEREFVSASGKSFSMAFMPMDFGYSSLSPFERIIEAAFPHYEPPTSGREIHILHQVFII